MGFDNIMNAFKKLGTLNVNIPKFDPPESLPYDYKMLDPDRKEYHPPEEIINESVDEFERPDFSSWKCEICGNVIEEGYFWYYLRDQGQEDNSKAVCSSECLDQFVSNNDCFPYEIYEYSRCNAYYKCEAIGNLRGICELVENKTYRSVMPFASINHCEPAQAGTILSTHKLTEVLERFSEQTNQQFLANKEMMDQSAEESTKQFRTTTIMTVLVIVLTIINLIPAFTNSNHDSYLGVTPSLGTEMEDINSKLDQISVLLAEEDSSSDEVITLLKSIEGNLKVIDE